MNQDSIREALDRAMAQGVKPFKVPPNVNPESFRAKTLLATRVTARGSIVESVVEVLKQESDLGVFDNGVMFIGTAIDQLSFEDLASWLLAQSLKHGSEFPVKCLDDALMGRNPDGFEILALCGITVREQIDISQ